MQALSLYELADLFVVVNKFVEIGNEFSNQTESCQIKSYFDSVVLKDYIANLRE